MAAAGAAPAAKLEDADALIDSVETFIFDCDGECSAATIGRAGAGFLGGWTVLLKLARSLFVCRRCDLEGR